MGIPIRCRLVRKSVYFILLVIMVSGGSLALKGQGYLQNVKGILYDQESRQPVAEGILRFTNQKDEFQAFSDAEGKFKLQLPSGRWELYVTRLGYGPKVVSNIQVGTGKEVMLEILLEAKVYETQEVLVSAGKKSWLTPSGGASVRTLQSQDATRFAGGYYDPLRMVANFAGVSSGNSDESNEIVVRGNSPRGLSWRLEGMEIPNPNHLSGGAGNNGGAYSMISTNVLADFDFFSGAFPAEYGNATSGVMDLRLRKGNTDKHEYGLQLSVVGAEAAAEGPLGKSGSNSFLCNVRYANFNILKKYGIVAVQDLSIIPSSLDWTLKMNFHGEKMGDLELFSVGGNSKTGNEAILNKADIARNINSDEWLTESRVAVFGIRHLKNFKDGKTYLRTIVGLTRSDQNWHEGAVDTTFKSFLNKQDWFVTPVIQASLMLNRKINNSNSLRVGMEMQRSFDKMFSIRRLTAQTFDTLVNERATGNTLQAYVQWKIRPNNHFEMTPAIHFTHTDINREWTVEPRLGLNVQLKGNQSLNFATGIYSRMEPVPIYFFRVKSGKTRRLLNENLLTTKAFHLVTGYRKSFNNDLRITIEGYYQHLYDVPVSTLVSNTFSMVNMSDGLPDIDLCNDGLADNTGIELTIDKSYSHGYYFLGTASIFDSRYKAFNTFWYSSYYNSNWVMNLLVGKEFKVGKYKQNILGFNLRNIARGGYRYTPPDEAASLIKKSVIYNAREIYGMHLPNFDRLDAGVNYRINGRKSAFNVSIDIQNILNRKNVYRRTFSYSKGAVIASDKKLIGLVPIAGFRFDF